MNKSEMEITKQDDKYILKQTHIRELTFKEAIQTIQQIESDIANSQQQITKQEDEIKNKVHETNLEQSRENVKVIEKLKAEWQEILQPTIKITKAVMKASIKKLKKEHNYDEIKAESKIALSNQIMNTACDENELDYRMPFLSELRREFEEI